MTPIPVHSAHLHDSHIFGKYYAAPGQCLDFKLLGRGVNKQQWLLVIKISLKKKVKYVVGDDLNWIFASLITSSRKHIREVCWVNDLLFHFLSSSAIPSNFHSASLGGRSWTGCVSPVQFSLRFLTFMHICRNIYPNDLFFIKMKVSRCSLA